MTDEMEEMAMRGAMCGWHFGACFGRRRGFAMQKYSFDGIGGATGQQQPLAVAVAAYLSSSSQSQQQQQQKSERRSPSLLL